MTDDVRFSVLRRKLLAGLGAAAIGGVTGSAVGRAAPAGAQESKSGAVVPSILAFGVNDSLLDIRHLAPLFERLFGDGKFVNEWYAQVILHLEAITLAGGPYIPFFNLAAAVLESMGAIHSVSIHQPDIAELGMRSATMPAHGDVPAGLKQLKDAGFRLVTLSNSPQGVQIAQLRHAGIDGYFERLLSVDLVRRFKPAPQMYHMAAEELFVSTAAICMVSTHVWDNLGAQNAGCSAALVARPGNAPSPALGGPGWPAPAAVGPNLPSVAAQLIKLWR
jgi:2-haloacid dehalogenase